MSDYDILKNEIDENTLTYMWEFGDSIKIPDGFKDWFFKNAKFLSKISELPADLKIKQDTNGQCFHNSQLVALENKDVKYYEGFLYGPEFKNCIHHGFNKCEAGPIDVTYLKNKEHFHNDDMRDKYYVYYGVEIPNDFIEKYRDKIDKANQQNPILLDYYNSFAV